MTRRRRCVIVTSLVKHHLGDGRPSCPRSTARKCPISRGFGRPAGKHAGARSRVSNALLRHSAVHMVACSAGRRSGAPEWA